MAIDDSARSKETTGAWIVHHGHKVAADMSGAAEFPALDTTAKAASLLSQLAASDEITIPQERAKALAKAAKLNPRTELPSLVDILKVRRLIDVSAGGDIVVLGLSTRGALQHTADIFAAENPTVEEQAAIGLAEISSSSPLLKKQVEEYIGDTYKMPGQRTADFLRRAEGIGFVDAEGRDADKLYFNGNLFRRGAVNKIKRVLDSLSSADQLRTSELNALLAAKGCVTVVKAAEVLGPALFDKLKAAGMYDVSVISNQAGDATFVTKPDAFHKFSDPLVDDAFDLAKALVAALTYGMTLSAPGRGRISMIGALLRKLIRGHEVGPATAIGEDYKVLEYRGVIQVTPERGMFKMRLLKKDIGEMALQVLTTGDATPASVLDKPLPGSMTAYSGPERSRTRFRQDQSEPSRRHTQDVLNALRTEGGIQ